MAVYITREELAQILQDKPESVTVVDVRDDDHVGGHIRGSMHVPSQTLDWRMPELVRTLKDKQTVVFHCVYSQMRGPKACRQYREQRAAARAKTQKQEDDAETKPAEDRDPQRPYILKGGFHSWQAKYGHDSKLTESYAADIWAEYWE